MDREIKFRLWNPERKVLTSGLGLNTILMTTDGEFVKDFNKSGMIWMQYTGKQGFNKKELYEGDIVFYEEAEEGGDRRFWLVIVWVPEWSMFASLHMSEYLEYLKEGVESLDEVMFWTYTLQDSEHFHYAGTIYENPELLNNV